MHDKQCTVVWDVDDNKISHEDSKVVDTVMKAIFPGLVTHSGKDLDFLGMN